MSEKSIWDKHPLNAKIGDECLTTAGGAALVRVIHRHHFIECEFENNEYQYFALQSRNLVMIVTPDGKVYVPSGDITKFDNTELLELLRQSSHKIQKRKEKVVNE